MKKNSKGFTITELLVVLAIISIMLGISVVAYRSFQVKTDIDAVQTTIVQSLRRAQVLAKVSEGDSDWGVFIQSQSVTIFKGNDYSSRDQQYDEVYDYSKRINPSQNYEIAFSKFTGAPQYIGDVILIAQNNTKIVNINNKGLISY